MLTDKQKQIKKFHGLCQVILDQDSDKLSYAKAYTQAGQGLVSLKAIKIQILYILSNLQYWKGDLARQTKAALKNL